uniref:Zinc finger protein ZFPM1 n=1 Tax=Denticeps clupeoides TaxID=299321 RepID=A0AAY4DPN6_9TELE
MLLSSFLASSGSIGDLDGGEENAPDDVSMSGDEGGASDPEDSAECDSSSPPSFAALYNEEPSTEEPQAAPDSEEEEEKGLPPSTEEEEEMEEEDDDRAPHWNGPDELELSSSVEGAKVHAVQDLAADTLWGPYDGSIQSEEAEDSQANEGPAVTLLCADDECWLGKVTVTCSPTEANCTIYSQGEELFCKVTRAVPSGEVLLATLAWPTTQQTSGTQTQHAPVKEERAYPAALHSEIQLLPQQAGMAAILATAVVNKDIFPCKDCGIWYRSERNLQAHLMYYCASRQKQPAAASPPQDKPKDAYPNERICPFPQCNKSCPSTSSLEIHMRTHSGERPFVCLICMSAFTTKANCERHLKVHTDTLNGVCHGCGFISTTRDILYSHLVTSHMVCQPGSHSEVYSPSPGVPKLPVATGLSPGDSGIVLKCQVCGTAADTPALLQQHVRTHLEVRVPAERSPTPRQTSPSSTHLPQPQEREPAACVPRTDSTSPGANSSSATPLGLFPLDPLPPSLQIKEEPRSDSENDEHEETGQENPDGEEVGCHGDEMPPKPVSSPKSPTRVVKAEPNSPTPGSSPVHSGSGGSPLSQGAMFLPQYMFSTEAAIMPQASEILAKMSEMVHSRLKQGQGPAPQGLYPAGATASIHKGATCYECDITFNNINNFYVHKRLYCSSRHQQNDTAGGTKDVTATSASVGCGQSPPAAAGSDGSQLLSASPSDSDGTTLGGSSSDKQAEVKSETPGHKDTGCSSSSEGEGGGGGGSGGGGSGGGRASEGSQSPGGVSVEEPDEDPSRTFCEACNIRFSRHENYTVHKRFYCASRHDPSNQRTSHAGKAAFVPQPFRTRKRKKMYEIHMARSEALANARASPTMPNLSLKQEVSTPSSSAVSVMGVSVIPPHSTSPEGEGPIDLSNSLPALPLTDYHKCTACSISFNSIENYLAHKTYYCPATTLQPHTLEQLYRLKRPASTSPKNRGLDLHTDGPPSTVQGGKAPLSTIAVALQPSLPGSEAFGIGAKPASVPPGTPPVVCPYCPPSRALTCDLVDHFRSAHGLVLTQQQADAQPAVVSPKPSLSPRDGAPATPPKPGAPLRRDSINGRARGDGATPPSPRMNGSPGSVHMGGSISPQSASQTASPPSTLPLTVSPVPEAVRETAINPTHTPNESHTPTATPKAPPTLQNGNTRYCRHCNIKFSSLSTFIAHKKYYCSSHSAEHVK